MMNVFGLAGAAAAGLDAVAAAGVAGALCGFAVSAACPNAIPDKSRTVKSPRIMHLQDRYLRPISPRIPRILAATMRISGAALPRILPPVLESWPHLCNNPGVSSFHRERPILIYRRLTTPGSTTGRIFARRSEL